MGTVDGEEHPYYVDTFPRTGAAHCQDVEQRQYVAAGYADEALLNDVWMSLDGILWRLQSDSAPFPPVYQASMTADSTGRLYLVGGVLQMNKANPRMTSSEVWSSTTQGRTWSPMLSGFDSQGQPLGPSARAAAQLLAMPTGQLLWMTGVNPGLTVGDSVDSYLKDTWISSSQGRGWGGLTLPGPGSFGRRADARAVVTAEGVLWLAAGYSGGTRDQAEVYNGHWHHSAQRG